MNKTNVLWLVCQCCCMISALRSNYTFPKKFLFGTATSAHQIEGAWDVDGKGENIWDHLAHFRNELIEDASNADVACDSYNRYLEDIKMLKDLGVDFYRLSLAWSRILPNGFGNKINQKGIDFYNNLINALLENNIQPMVTLYHWDLPQPLQDIGGFMNPKIVDLFTEYAKVAFENFGDRVKTWFTFNEPRIICSLGVGDVLMAPALNLSGTGDYLCAHNLLKAHASVYHMYDKDFRPTQKGRISIVIDIFYPIPATNSSEDVEARNRQLDFSIALYTHPIFHPEGNYPQAVIERVSNRSKAEGFRRSRLPPLTDDEVNYIKGTYDFFGLNHYSAELISNVEELPVGDPSFIADKRLKLSYDPSWSVSNIEWMNVVPSAFRDALLWIRDNCNGPEIMVLENGYSDDGRLDDQDRIQYFKLYLATLLETIEQDGVNITAYAAWSLMDDFEWLTGYTLKFGLYHVNFDHQNRTRTAKSSARFFKELLSTRLLTIT